MDGTIGVGSDPAAGNHLPDFAKTVSHYCSPLPVPQHRDEA